MSTAHGKTSITITFDPNGLSTYTDRYLSMLWHLCQHNPTDGFRDKEPGDLAMRVGWEIIRRWLGTVSPEMYHHQQQHYTWWQLTQFARNTDAGLAPRMIPGTNEMHAALAAKLAELRAFAGTMSREQLARELTGIVMPQRGGDDPDQGDPAWDARTEGLADALADTLTQLNVAHPALSCQEIARKQIDTVLMRQADDDQDGAR